MKELKWVESRSILAIHDGVLAVDSGVPGVSDLGLLKSAKALPRKLYAYVNKPDIFTFAAAYTAGIVKNHQCGRHFSDKEWLRFRRFGRFRGPGGSQPCRRKIGRNRFRGVDA